LVEKITRRRNWKVKRYGKEELKSEKIEEIQDSKKGSRERRTEN